MDALKYYRKFSPLAAAKKNVGKQLSKKLKEEEI